MRNGALLAIAGLVLLGGCSTPATLAPKPSVSTQWKAPYHIDLDTIAAQPKAVLTLPRVRYTANPKLQERRACLVVQFDATGAKNDQPANDRVILYPIDVPGTSGTLPAEYVNTASQQLTKLFTARCLKGTVKIRLALVRSSIKPEAGDTEINAKRLTDWVPAEVVFKNPHPKC